MKAPKVSLEQWRALQAVVDAGGYAQAAEVAAVLARITPGAALSFARMTSV